MRVPLRPSWIGQFHPYFATKIRSRELLVIMCRYVHSYVVPDNLSATKGVAKMRHGFPEAREAAFFHRGCKVTLRMDLYE